MAATSRPVGPSAVMRAITRAVFSSTSSVRMERSSSGSRPTSDMVAAKRLRFSGAAAAWAISASTAAAARAVVSTRCSAGPTRRTENWRGSEGASSSVPSRSSKATETQASSAATPTTVPGRFSRRETRASRPARVFDASASKTPRRTIAVRGRNQLPSAGIRNTATARDASSDSTTVKAMPSIRRAASPSTNSTGRKTTQVVSVLATIAPATWPVPLAAASSGESPAPRRRYMDSTTTMALSTSMPTPSASPPRVTTLRLWSAKFMPNNVAKTETGTAAATIMVAPGERRNSASTKTASRMPAAAAIFRSSKASLTSWASSAISWTSTPGRSSCSPASALRMSAETPTVFAPASL